MGNRRVWNGTEAERDPFREFFRAVLPDGSDGFGLNDLDLICRQFRKYENTPRAQQRFRHQLESSGISAFPTIVDDLIRFNRTLDDIGVYRLIETKIVTGRRIPGSLDESQQRQFTLLDRQVTATSYEPERYLGFYVLDMNDRDPDTATRFYINGVETGLSEVVRLVACLPVRVPTRTELFDQWQRPKEPTR